MKVQKKVIDSLTKCYSLAKLNLDEKQYLLCAAEKEDACYMYDLDGNRVDTLWDGPGGVMTMEQFTSSKMTALLATQKFYSPNNSKEASIVYLVHEDGKWIEKKLCDLPFVHRFGILHSNCKQYLIACTLKSAHAYKDDWTCPGRVWVAELPDDLSVYDADHQLELTPIMNGLYKNHGFCKTHEGDQEIALIGTQNGVFKIIPPTKENDEWQTIQLIDHPASDILLADFDDDGKKELLVMSPFHGEDLSIYHEDEKGYRLVYTYPKELPFLHAICELNFHGKEYAIVGNRKGDRDLLGIYFDHEIGNYMSVQLDQGAGAANVLWFQKDGVDHILAANRETDEIAIYTLEEL